MSKVRNVYVTLKDKLINAYLDEDANPVFSGELLEELEVGPCPAASSSSAPGKQEPTCEPTQAFLVQQIALLQTQIRENNTSNRLNESLKRFACGEFDGSSDGKRFLISFEADCEKHLIHATR